MDRDEAPNDRDLATKHNLPHPKVILSDGNVFSILAACRKADIKASWPRLAVQELVELMMAQKDYDNVLQVALLNFNVSLEGDVAEEGQVN